MKSLISTEPYTRNARTVPSEASDSVKSRLRLTFILIALSWTGVIAALTAWDYRHTRAAALTIARAGARSSYDKDLVYRRWAALHGGVYVPITPQTSPNPHLSHVPERDIETPSGKKLTLMNPAYMTRQVHEMGEAQYGDCGHITSLKPIRPENAPDEWERNALLAFERGEKEVSSLEVIGNETYLRLMRPMRTEPGCLTCHAAQGYKEGDIRGGISVSIPWKPSREALLAQLPLHIIGSISLWAIGILGLCVAWSRIQKHLSERKRAEEALSLERDRFKHFLDAMPDPVYIIDRDYNLQYVNPALEREFGPTNGRKCFDYFHGLGDVCPWCRNSEVFRGETIRWEWFWEKTGKTYDLVDVPIRNSDGSLWKLEIFHDISERRQVEEALRQSKADLEQTNRQLEEAIERANRMALATEMADVAKSEFLANMSHEIRTPMTAIMGYSDLVAESLDGCTACAAHETCQISAQNHQHMQAIRRNGEHLLSLINDILDLSKIEAGKMTVEHLPCSPHQLVAEVDSLVRVRAETKGLTFKAEFVGGIPETIQTDPLRLRQILINLIGNALKFTEDGEIRIVVSHVPEADGSKMQFDIIDTGIGMTAKQASRLFQAFSQADGSTTRRFGGSGLGLVISKRLAQVLGGDVTLVETQPSVGTRFRATVATGSLEGVPMIEGTANRTRMPPQREIPESKTEAVNDKPLRSRRILLAEDGPDNQRLIEFVLKAAGADVEVVDNGRSAVKRASAARAAGSPFDVILMDMQMPILDGYEATAILRDSGYTGPIVALTAHAMASDRDKCLLAGCNGYATKPLDREKLIETLRTQCAHFAESGPAPVSNDPSLVSELGRDPDLRGLVVEFVSGLPERVAALQRALESGALDILASLAHQLKGSGGSYGYPDITEIAGQLEQLAKANGDAVAIGEQIAQLARLCERARRGVETQDTLGT